MKPYLFIRFVHNSLRYLILVISIAIPCNSLYGKPVVEKVEGFDIDWGNLKIRFLGKGVPENPQESFSEILKKALADGLLAIRDSVTNYHQGHLVRINVDQVIAGQSGKAAGNRVARSTYSYRNEYFGDGTVVVYLENSLAKALRRQDVIFQQQSAMDINESVFSGIVLRSSKAIRPYANYRLQDETGKILFKIQDVAKEAYEKNLMGRWFVNPSRGELTQVLGSKFISLPVEPDSQGNFRVQSQAWKEAVQDSKAVLANARIVIALPQVESKG